MGRRSINTTKSGKYMNPTDQARKEARKKELKKNKKQRQMVRQAVLKGKDPAMLLDEMEKIDEMEYNVYQPSPLNEKVLKEKRKKLKETFDRVMRLYHTEDPELFTELKRKEVEYEKKRNKRITYFESVRQAESIQVDDIPLPSTKEGAPTPSALPRIQLPPPALIIPPIPQAFAVNIPKPVEEPPEEQIDDEVLLKAPGCPPYQPPNLLDMEDLDSDYDEALLPKNQKRNKVSSKDESEDKASGSQNIDEFMKEMENVHKRKEAERARKTQKSDSDSSDSESSEIDSDLEADTEKPTRPANNSKPIPSAAANLPPQMPMHVPIMPRAPAPINIPGPPMMPHIPALYRPPPLRGFPGVPNPSGLRLPRMGIRMPPGPPPGLPPKYAKGAQVNKDPKSVTIEAKPQIRNLSADVTRFVPAALRSKKEDPKKPKPKTTNVTMQQQTQPSKGPTKDDAYMQFMKEMQGFL